MKLRISDNLVLGADFVTSTQAILAQKGKGKSYAAAVEAEEMLDAGQLVVIVDPTDAHYGLRSSPDGRSTGYPIAVFGGDHGDVQLEPGGGAVLAEAIVRERFSAIVCTETMTKGEELRFVGDFLETLYRKNREAMHLFLDEADIFCLDEETEILTREGWRRHQEIEVGASVVAFNLANSEYRYETISHVVRKWHDGPMVALKNKNIDIRVTPEHRVVLRREQRAQGRRRLYDWTFVEAHAVPHQVHIPSGGAPSGDGLPISDDLLRLIGWIASDGFFAGAPRKRKYFGHYLGIQQAVATNKAGRSMVGELDALLARLDSKGRYERPARKGGKGGGPSVSYYLGRELSEKVLAWTGSEIHRISRRLITECSRAQLEVLMQGLLEGDGTFSKRVGEWVTFYAGHNSGIADDFQEIGLRLGLSVSKRHLDPSLQWTVQISRRGHHCIRRPSVASYAGIVWCVTLPSGAFVARRDGCVFVTGNCPQQPYGGEARTTGATDDIVRRGRKKGIGCTLITQRASVLNKNVLSQADMLIAMGCSHPLDLDAIDKWVRRNADAALAKEMMQSLPSLPRGEAWAWNPAQHLFKRIAIRQRRTFDSGATPKAGEKKREPKILAPVDIARLGQSMAEAVQRQKENDPKALKVEVARLKKANDELAAGAERAIKAQLGKAPAVEKTKIVVKKVEVVKPADLRRLEALVKKIDKLILRITGTNADLELHLSGLRVEATKLQEVAARVTQLRGKKAGALVGEVLALAPEAPIEKSWSKGDPLHHAYVSHPPAKPKPPKPVNPTKSVKQHLTNGHADAAPEGLKPAHLRLLSAIAWWEAIGVTEPDLGGVAFVAKTSTKSSAFDNNRSRLRAAGYIDYPQTGRVRLTAAGRQLAPPPPIPPTNEALQRAVFEQVSPALGRLLRVLIDTYPNEMALEDFATAAGTSATSSAFDNNRSWLRARGLATYPRTGFVRATELLFPEAS